MACLRSAAGSSWLSSQREGRTIFLGPRFLLGRSLRPAVFFSPILAAIDTYRSAKKNGSTDALQQALVVGAKVLAIVFLAWVAVVELHGLLPEIESLREVEPSLLLAGFTAMASSMLV